MPFRALSYKTKQFFVVLIKLSLVVGAFYFIYLKIAQNDTLSFDAFLGFLHQNRVFSIKNIAFLVGLSSLNWFFEILKWKTLVQWVTPISLKRATEQTLGALTASLFTPNRIGDYGAKAMYFAPPLKKRILLLNLLNNASQMGITFMLGLAGLVLLQTHFNVELALKKALKIATLLVLIGSVIGFGLNRIKGQTWPKLISFFKTFPKPKLMHALCLALVRYAIFSFQFYWLLRLFNVPITYFDAMIMISSMYLLASIIPSLAIFDVVIKGSISVYLFGLLGVNAITVLSTVTIMWVLNFALPSILGSYYVLHFKFPKSD